jgi:hypothetical protein
MIRSRGRLPFSIQAIGQDSKQDAGDYQNQHQENEYDTESAARHFAQLALSEQRTKDGFPAPTDLLHAEPHLAQVNYLH